MKKSIHVRILTALASLVLLALGGCVAAEGFFGLPVLAKAAELLAANTGMAMLWKGLCAVGLAVLAVMTFMCTLPPLRTRQRDYVIQKGEDGPIGISIKAIEKKVLTCVSKYKEIARADVAVREVRDGIVVLLHVDQMSGVNIPISVGLLQKQIREYVRECTGVSVTEVRVMVDNRTDAQVDSIFLVDEAVLPGPRRVEASHQESLPAPESLPEQWNQLEELAWQNAPQEEIEPEKPNAPSSPVDILDELLPVMDAVEPVHQENEKPMHQRIYGDEEELLSMPMPPAGPEAEVCEAQAEETEAEEAETLPGTAASETTPAEEAPVEPAPVETAPVEEAPQETAAVQEAATAVDEPQQAADDPVPAEENAEATEMAAPAEAMAAESEAMAGEPETAAEKAPENEEAAKETEIPLL